MSGLVLFGIALVVLASAVAVAFYAVFEMSARHSDEYDYDDHGRPIGFDPSVRAQQRQEVLDRIAARKGY